MIIKTGSTKVKINRPTPIQFVLVGLVIALVLSAVVLWINKGFYFAAFEDTYILDLPENAAGEAKYADLSKGQYVAQLDRDHHAVYFQNILAQDINRIFSDVSTNADTVDAALTETNIIHTDIFLVRVVILMVLTSILFAISMYYFVIRKLKGRQMKIWRLMGLLYLSALIGIFANLGLLSLVSRIYNLSNVSISSLAIGLMWGIFLIYFVAYDFAVKHNGEMSLAEGINMNYRHTGGVNRVAWAFLGAVLVIVTFGLGSKFIVEGVLVFMTVFTVSVFLQYFPLVIYRLNRNAIRSIRQNFQVLDNTNLTEMNSLQSEEQLALKPLKTKKPAKKKLRRK